MLRYRNSVKLMAAREEEWGRSADLSIVAVISFKRYLGFFPQSFQLKYCGSIIGYITFRVQ